MSDFSFKIHHIQFRLGFRPDPLTEFGEEEKKERRGKEEGKGGGKGKGRGREWKIVRLFIFAVCIFPATACSRSST